MDGMKIKMMRRRKSACSKPLPQQRPPHTPAPVDSDLSFGSILRYDRHP